MNKKQLIKPILKEFLTKANDSKEWENIRSSRFDVARFYDMYAEKILKVASGH